MIQVRDVSVSIGTQTLLNSVSFTQEPGTFTAIIGPNGSGKSTLMKVLCGFFSSENKKVQLFHRKLDVWKPSELAKYRAVLPQESSLSFPFMVEEVVRMGLFPYGKNTSDLNIDSISKLLNLVGMEGLKHRIYTVLSGGEKQRTHLARVLAQIWNLLGKQSTILLADEPINGLDIKYQHQVLSLFKSLTYQKCTVLAVVHDLQLAAQYADQVLLMERGNVVAQGAPQDILTPENIECVFDVKMNSFKIIPNPLPYTITCL